MRLLFFQCQDNQDGSCTVDYVPTEEGDYDIAIKFSDEHIPGSPFKVSLSKYVSPNNATNRKAIKTVPAQIWNIDMFS